MTRETRWTAALALAAAVLPSACGGPGPAGRESGPEPVVRARVVTAERLEVPQEVEIYGTVQAARVANVSARVMAQVTALHVQAGDPVRRGQLLAEIDPRAARGQVSQARGALAQARAALALAERNYERFRGLAESDAASELEVDMARTQYEQARGAVEQARGAVAAATSVASDSRVVSPFDGRVERCLVEVGDLAAPGRPLFAVQSTDDARRLAVPVPESAVGGAGLAPGSPVRVEIDARPDLGSLAGTVAEMTPGADTRSHTFDVEVELPVAELPTGAAGRAYLAVGRREAVVVAAAAVLTRGGMRLVVVRSPDGTASSRVVTVGAELPGDRVEILSGLSGGETVLVDLPAVPPVGARVEEVAG